MKNLLLPHYCKKIGWIIFSPSIILGLYSIIFDYQSPYFKTKMPGILTDSLFGNDELNLWNTLIGVLFIIGGLLVIFSREQEEDEFIANLRLKAMLWAVLINYLLLLIAFVLVYNLSFLTVMTFNMFTVMILFIAKFNYSLYKTRKEIANEESN